MRLFLLALLLFATPSLAQDGAPAAPGYVTGNEASLQEQISNAEDGDIGSQYNLAMRYATGEGVPQDYALALKWLEMAANRGDMDAQAAAGIMHQKGQGTNADDHMAAHWYKRAALQGDRMSAFNLATLRANGQGSFRDDKEAYYWVTVASTMGEARVAALQGVLQARMSADDLREVEAKAAAFQPVRELDPQSNLLEQKRDGQ
ncbi:MAG TPA: tetratricopeptide repeat protein [Patescibacteria group bacterium]|nr:tetratricopeptide repeat protein [Patescibacteria group bacterium]